MKKIKINMSNSKNYYNIKGPSQNLERERVHFSKRYREIPLKKEGIFLKQLIYQIQAKHNIFLFYFFAE
jgi:hypothetical protein